MHETSRIDIPIAALSCRPLVADKKPRARSIEGRRQWPRKAANVETAGTGTMRSLTPSGVEAAAQASALNLRSHLPTGSSNLQRIWRGWRQVTTRPLIDHRPLSTRRPRNCRKEVLSIALSWRVALLRVVSRKNQLTRIHARRTGSMRSPRVLAPLPAGSRGEVRSALVGIVLLPRPHPDAAGRYLGSSVSNLREAGGVPTRREQQVCSVLVQEAWSRGIIRAPHGNGFVYLPKMDRLRPASHQSSPEARVVH